MPYKVYKNNYNSMILHSPNELGLYAIAQRKKLGLTQAEVAQRVGLQQKTISAFENRPASVKLATAFMILSSLDLGIKLISKFDNTDDKQSWDQAW